MHKTYFYISWSPKQYDVYDGSYNIISNIVTTDTLNNKSIIVHMLILYWVSVPSNCIYTFEDLMRVINDYIAIPVRNYGILDWVDRLEISYFYLYGCDNFIYLQPNQFTVSHVNTCEG